MDESPANRRRQPRLRRKLPVAIDLRGRTFGAVTQNLSQTGMLLHATQMLLAGTAVTGTIIADNLEIRFAALVRWSRSGSRSTSSNPQNSLGLEFLDAPGRAYTDFLAQALGNQEEQTRTNIDNRLPLRVPTTQSFSQVHAVLEEAEPQVTPFDRPPGDLVALPAPSPLTELATGRTNVSQRIANAELVEREMTPTLTRNESPTLEARISPRFGLVPGLTGKSEGSTRSNLQRQSGTSPLAISAAATLFERAAMVAVGGALPPGSQTVAMSMDLKLVLPAQVKLGGRLEAVATLTEVGADRTLRFRVELREGQRLVAQGEHVRLIT